MTFFILLFNQKVIIFWNRNVLEMVVRVEAAMLLVTFMVTPAATLLVTFVVTPVVY